jgi:hypothetical protein
MSVTSTLGRKTDHHPDEDESGSAPRLIDFFAATDYGSTEIDDRTKKSDWEQVVRKATSQLRNSVRLSSSLEDGLYSLISGRRVSPSSWRLSTCRISRSHQRI